VDPRRPYAFALEQERAASGAVVSVATVFLTNRECPWRCLMCDLWRNTMIEAVPPGAIPAQIDYALAGQSKAEVVPALASEEIAASSPTQAQDKVQSRLDARSAFPQRHIKLYNSGSFFDPRAIPPGDYPAIAERLRGFERVIVECHPALVGESAARFRDLLGYAKLEVAMGLETVHPEVLPRLNKRMTLDQFSRAAAFLRKHEIDLRVFILVKPPFLDEAEALLWARRSLDFAFDRGAKVASLIPTRLGNGAMEALAARGEFSPPKLATLEAALDYGVALNRGCVFADLWDLEKFSNCADCFGRRRERLHLTNLAQVTQPAVLCSDCVEIRAET
jgi:radical SAM enzyme (TIGR01210 family)